MAAYLEKETKIVKTDGEGNVKEVKITSATTTLAKNDEPDYIKIYAKNWLYYNMIPKKWQLLFLQLAVRMQYCHAKRLGTTAQVVNTGKPTIDIICQALEYNPQTYRNGLIELVKCGAIRRLERGVYQINPKIASKGHWKYNPRHDQGGVNRLVYDWDSVTPPPAPREVDEILGE
jgi:hypothetical protein